MSQARGSRVPINDRADEMIEYFESEDSVLYGDVVERFGDYVAYLAVERGPTSEVEDGSGRVQVTEADLAIASFLEDKLSEAEDIDVKQALEGGVSGLGALGSGGMLLRTGDPGWFVGGLLTGYYAKSKVEEVYEDIKERRSYREDRRESLEEFNEEHPDVEGYEVELEDIDDFDTSVSVVRPESEMDAGPERIAFQ